MMPIRQPPSPPVWMREVFRTPIQPPPAPPFHAFRPYYLWKVKQFRGLRWTRMGRHTLPLRLDLPRRSNSGFDRFRMAYLFPVSFVVHGEAEGIVFRRGADICFVFRCSFYEKASPAHGALHRPAPFYKLRPWS